MIEGTFAGIALIWALLILILSLGFLVANIKLFWYLIQRNKLAKDHIKMVKRSTEVKYNKFAMMAPSELDQYLLKLFSMYIQISADNDVSDRDHNATEKLYFNVATRIITYLGPDTVSAIEYFYGDNYIMRWCELQFIYLNRNNKLITMIEQDRPTTSTDILETKENTPG